MQIVLHSIKLLLQKHRWKVKKLANAASRRLVAKGDANTLYSISAPEENESQAGLELKKTIPLHLQKRLILSIDHAEFCRKLSGEWSSLLFRSSVV